MQREVQFRGPSRASTRSASCSSASGSSRAATTSVVLASELLRYEIRFGSSSLHFRFELSSRVTVFAQKVRGGGDALGEPTQVACGPAPERGEARHALPQAFRRRLGVT